MTREDMIDQASSLVAMNINKIRDEKRKDFMDRMEEQYINMYNYLSERETDVVEGILDEVQQEYPDRLGMYPSVETKLNNLGKKEDEQIN